MNPGQADKLIEETKNARADANRNTERIAGELVSLTQELYLLRKVAELLLSPAQREELARFTPPVAPPSPDLEHQEAAHQPTQAEIDEINRALMQGDLELGVNGVPVVGLR